MMDPDENLSMWTVYDHPRDWPDNFVARQWLVTKTGPEPTGNMLLSVDLELIRTDLRRLGLVQMARSAEDDPRIIETWI